MTVGNIQFLYYLPAQHLLRFGICFPCPVKQFKHILPSDDFKVDEFGQIAIGFIKHVERVIGNLRLAVQIYTLFFIVCLVKQVTEK